MKVTPFRLHPAAGHHDRTTSQLGESAGQAMAISRQPENQNAAVDEFRRRGGQLRVSFTDRCQIRCWFCHNEGDVPPHAMQIRPRAESRPSVLDPAQYNEIISTLVGRGFTRVYFTGGEPLVSPAARPVLEALPPHEPSQLTTVLITNGLLLPRHADWLGKTALDRVKVSLHYFSDDSMESIAGVRRVREVLAGIDLARTLFPAVELNTVVQRQNAHEIRQIIAFALERRLPIQFIGLVATDYNSSVAATTVDGLVDLLRSIAGAETVETGGTGQGRRIFTVEGVRVEVVDGTLGRHHVGQCVTCPVRQSCVEGFWALRVDSAGFAAPCLLRPDLRLDIRPHLMAGELGDAVDAHLARFVEGAL